MERIDNIDQAKEKVLSDMNTFLSSVREFADENVEDLGVGLSKLRSIRSSVYENLNQIQHEYLILQGLIWLNSNEHAHPETQWYWNPRQTGDSAEPDLRGTYEGQVVVSAEATTSEKPQGVIDTRMKNTMAKLNVMEGKKFYFIRTNAMEMRADTKATNNGWQITVVKLEG
ncbi:hypothetical protein DN730_05000 [Marinomonas piezotolerans]|uniref:Uncharacterized protein n=1 Tax=Marinomonas piezotolerans TaxID=2213058 RepID=A0A370UB46_9GAMM|nr:hypothetical protein [Marinomonas piezotolerans]RDL44978.1 hypothetical protein DN730_05000 [Marinomonas piezotolerans]